MKKVLLLLLCPLVIFGQVNLVRWYNSDFTPTLLENHITASNITANGGVGLSNNNGTGVDNVFYLTSNWPSNSSLIAGKYIQFAISPASGYKIDLSQFSFRARNQGSDSQKFQVLYSKSSGFASYSTLQGETTSSTSFTAYNLSFPANTVVTSGETMYVRLYVYNTYNNFQIEHNNSGTAGPLFYGKVSLVTPVVVTASDDKAGTLKNTAVNIDILQNDSYQYTSAITSINIVTQPQYGTLTVNGTTNVSYTPGTDYTGYDSFYYTVTNSVGVSNTAKVEIQVVDGTEQVMERWNTDTHAPINYVTGVSGLNITASSGITMSNDTSWVGGVQYKVYKSIGWPYNDGSVPDAGGLDTSKYIQIGVTPSQTLSVSALLSKMKIEYNANTTGAISVKYSKDVNFVNAVSVPYTSTFANNSSSGWNSTEISLQNSFVYPGETFYIRIYVYKATYSSAQFYLKYGIVNNSTLLGPTVSGYASEYYPEPCTTTVTWTGTWSGTPNINKKAILAANYDTSVNGNFEACTLAVNTGYKLTIAQGNYVRVYSGINLADGAGIDMKSGANLVQVSDSASNVGSITVKREASVPSSTTAQYVYWSSPVADQNYKTIFSGYTATALYYNEATDYFGTSSGAYILGRSLAVKNPVAGNGTTGTTLTAEFKGKPYNGAFDYTLAYSGSSRGNNLVGNPYPSDINLKLLYSNSTGIDSTFKFWDNKSNNINSQQGSSYKGHAYASFNALAGTNGTGTAAAGGNGLASSGNTPSNIAKVGQGFIVKAVATGAKLSFKNTQRTYTQAGNFYGKTNNAADDRYWLEMVTPSDMVISNAIVYFADGNKGFSADDTQESDVSDGLFTYADDKKVIINGRNTFDDADVLNLGVRNFTAGIYKIRLGNLEGAFANGQSIYLKDRVENTLTDLTKGDYTYTSEAGEFIDRFEIVYKESSLGTSDAPKQYIQIYKNGSDIVVKSFAKDIKNIELYDFSGRLVVKCMANSKEYRFPSSSLLNGVYMVKVLLSDGEISVKKVIK